MQPLLSAALTAALTPSTSSTGASRAAALRDDPTTSFSRQLEQSRQEAQRPARTPEPAPRAPEHAPERPHEAQAERSAQRTPERTDKPASDDHAAQAASGGTDAATDPAPAAAGDAAADAHGPARADGPRGRGAARRDDGRAARPARGDASAGSSSADAAGAAAGTAATSDDTGANVPPAAADPGAAAAAALAAQAMPHPIAPPAIAGSDTRAAAVKGDADALGAPGRGGAVARADALVRDGGVRDVRVGVGANATSDTAALWQQAQAQAINEAAGPRDGLTAASPRDSAAVPSLSGLEATAAAGATAHIAPGARPAGEVAVAQLATPADGPDFRAALGTQVAVFAKNGVQQAELHLNPAEMGPVTIQIVLDGQQAQVNFGAESAHTRALIESGMPELAGALRDAGLTLTGGGVSQHAGGGRHDGASSGAGAGPAGSRDDGAIDIGSDAAAARPLVTRVRAGGVDLYA